MRIVLLVTIFAITGNGGGSCLPKVKANTEKIRRGHRILVMSMKTATCFPKPILTFFPLITEASKL